MDVVDLSSRAVFLVDSVTGRGIAAVAADERTAVASMTKIMTALVTLKNRNLDEAVTITPEMLSGLGGYAKLGLRVGQTATVEDLLYATMLPSAGDAAQALAVYVGGSLDGFAEMMNQEVRALGLKDTHFDNAVGIDSAENYATPREMAVILQEALKNAEFVKIFETYEKELPYLGVTVRKTFAQSGVIKGGKTGWTDAAGRCLASTAEVEGQEYILVTVGAELGENVKDAEKVYTWLAENYEPVRVVNTGDILVRIPVKESATKVAEITASEDVVRTLAVGTQAEDLEYIYEGDSEITRETDLAEKLGELRILQNGEELYAQDVYWTEEVEFYNYGWLVLGVGVSVILLGLAIFGLVKGFGKKKKRWGKVLGIVALVGCLLSIVFNIWWFADWFKPSGKLEVMRPDVLVMEETIDEDEETTEEVAEPEEVAEVKTEEKVVGNCSVKWGNLMLINPNFKVGDDFITARKKDLISVSQTYGIPEYNAAVNGDNLLQPEAAAKLTEMVKAYEVDNPGHTMGTRSCFRVKGTSCGRLCAATGTSDHHTGLTCDLIDTAYGTALETDDYAQHQEWQWLKANSYKYGFIDRFPEAWAGGSMSEPLNVDANGSTGLYETWHYRYVGVQAATEIATGKYNNGQYDSLEHYLKTISKVADLKNGTCAE